MAFKNYYHLAKPGIIYGNVITLAGGFAVAMRASSSNLLSLAVTFLGALIGLSLVIASGSVINNLIDSDIDAKMERTQGRELVVGSVSRRVAKRYAFVLGVAGFLILFLLTNLLTVAVAAFGYFAYIVLYSLWAKRRSVYGPHVGALSGAVPPVVGYVAVANRFDAGALILFAILFLWQIPHFFAIAIYRGGDYAAAEIPVMPIRRGLLETKINMVVYIVAFAVAAILLFMFGYIGAPYLVVTILANLVWLYFSARGFWITDVAAIKKWARKMFFVSLIVLTVIFIAMLFSAVI